MFSYSIRFSTPSFWMGGGLESLCVGADGAVRVKLAFNIISGARNILVGPDSSVGVATGYGLYVSEMESL